MYSFWTSQMFFSKLIRLKRKLNVTSCYSRIVTNVHLEKYQWWLKTDANLRNNYRHFSFDCCLLFSRILSRHFVLIFTNFRKENWCEAKRKIWDEADFNHLFMFCVVESFWHVTPCYAMKTLNLFFTTWQLGKRNIKIWSK